MPQPLDVRGPVIETARGARERSNTGQEPEEPVENQDVAVHEEAKP
jgi:hypothetical protein